MYWVFRSKHLKKYLFGEKSDEREEVPIYTSHAIFRTRITEYNKLGEETPWGTRV